MHSQSLRMTLLSITTVSSFYAGLSMRTAHAATEANVDPSEGATTLEPMATEDLAAATQATPLPQPVVSEPSLQPRFASQNAAKVMPKPAVLSPEPALLNSSYSGTHQSIRDLPDRATLLQRLTTSTLPAETAALSTDSTSTPAVNAGPRSQAAEVNQSSPLENSAPTQTVQSASTAPPTLFESESGVMLPHPAVTPDGRTTAISLPVPLPTRIREPQVDDGSLWELATPGQLISPEQPEGNTHPVTATESEAVAIGATALQPSEPAPEIAAAPYQIQPGDTLLKIADELNVSVEELAQANNIKDVNLIRAGAELIIPAADEEVAEAVPASESVVAADFAQIQANTGGVNEAMPAAIATPTPQHSTSLLDHLQSTAIHQVNAETLLARLQNTNSTIVASSSLPESDITRAPGITTESFNTNSENNIETASNRNVSSTDTDIYTANLVAAVDATQAAQDNAIEIAVIPAEPTNPSILASLPTPSLPIPTVASPTVASPTVASPTVTPSLPRALLAAAPLSPNILGTRRPAPGDIVEPQMPLLPNAQEYVPQSSAFNGYVWPAPGRISSGYGWRWGRMHRGVDIAAPTGTPVMAAAPGVVEFAGWNNGGYGNLVDIRHPDGSMTRYAHNSRLTVRAGQSVLQGQLISEVGSTGYSTGPHLHFEIHQPNRGTVNPIALLPGR